MVQQEMSQVYGCGNIAARSLLVFLEILLLQTHAGHGAAEDVLPLFN
jgi:hypothetical protein